MVRKQDSSQLVQSFETIRFHFSTKARIIAKMRRPAWGKWRGNGYPFIMKMTHSGDGTP